MVLKTLVLLGLAVYLYLLNEPWLAGLAVAAIIPHLGLLLAITLLALLVWNGFFIPAGVLGALLAFNLIGSYLVEKLGGTMGIPGLLRGVKTTIHVLDEDEKGVSFHVQRRVDPAVVNDYGDGGELFATSAHGAPIEKMFDTFWVTRPHLGNRKYVVGKKEEWLRMRRILSATTSDESLANVLEAFESKPK